MKAIDLNKMNLYLTTIKNFLVLVFVFSVIVFALHYAVVGQATYGDGRAYYSYLLSIVFDGDMDMKNQMTHHWEPHNNNSLHPVKIPSLYFAPENAIGTSVFWIAPMFLSIIVSKILNLALNLELPVHGYTNFSQVLVGITSIILFVFGLHYTFKNLKKYYSHNISLLAILFIWLSTNLFYYSSIDVLNSHPISFFITAFTLYAIFNENKWQVKHVFIRYGFLFGLVFIVREQDILSLVPIFAYKLWESKPQYKILLTSLLLFLGAFSLPLSLQFLYNLQNFNSLYHPHFNVLQWHIPNLFTFLFSAKRGSILIYSPSIFLAIYGLIISKIKGKEVLLLTIFAQILISSAWNEGSSYGPRTLITTYPILALGLAELLKDKRYIKILSAMTVLNFMTIFYFLLFATGINSSGIDPTTLTRVKEVLKLFM